MHVTLKTSVSSSRVRESIWVRVDMHKKNKEDKWASVEEIGFVEIKLKDILGYKPISKLSKEITSAQTKLLNKFKKNHKYMNVISDLCKNYDGAELIVQDGKTVSFIKSLTGNKT